MKQTPPPVMLIILDGFGYTDKTEENATKLANMPNWKSWLSKYPNTLLKASGNNVGLPSGYMGNSEVGHLTIGAGRTIKSILSKFHEEINNKNIFSHPTLVKNLSTLKDSGKSLHIMGLLSDAGVHSHEKHFFALIELAHKIGVKKIFVHPFLDGRDTPPKSASTYLQKLETICNKFHATIATLHGRFYAMDRDNNWDRTEASYKTLTVSQPQQDSSWQEAIEKAYQNTTDEFVVPIQLKKDGIIRDSDGVIFINFRPDRARQLTESFVNKSFSHFKTANLKIAFFITAVQYKKEFNNEVLFKEEPIRNTLLDVLEEHNKSVFIVAETEKAAHVTYFFRGMLDKLSANEERVIIPSLKLKNYSSNPEMSAPQITDVLLKSLQEAPKAFYLANYANADMVGHGGNLEATIKACQCLDKELKRLYDEVIIKQNGTLFITADHGNAEENLTHHTTNLVPFIMINKQLEGKAFCQNDSYGLNNIASTILSSLEIIPSQEMESPLILN